MPLVTNTRELGALARERRRALGLTQEAVATRLGASRRWVAAVERGAPRSELGLVLRLLRVLGLALSADEPPPAETPTARSVDLDAVLQRTLERG